MNVYQIKFIKDFVKFTGETENPRNASFALQELAIHTRETSSFRISDLEIYKDGKRIDGEILKLDADRLAYSR